ncbi:MAG: CDP-glycerol glycerophosphotransferase family protein [Ancrocorticia sp.]|uniref:CDP-glycerol glycerophosphotransferase family protein n=1 Tax=Ancrocorticia sp. TaxID=2593684 RepID=UPI003F901ECC
MSIPAVVAAGTRAVMRAVYAPMKRFCRTDPCKVVLISRQSDHLSIDFELTLQEITSRLPEAKTVVITKRLEKSWRSALGFFWAQIASLYHLATAQVALLESYWPAVSAVEHKEELTVFQLWHSLGKIKKSGRQTVGQQQGWSASVANELRMHHGYDFVVAGAEAWNPAYRASFGIAEHQILNIGLPRADYLINHHERASRAVFQSYPELNDGKPIVLYAPTFRRTGGASTGAKNVLADIDTTEFHLVVKGHANQPLLASHSSVIECSEFTGMELLAVADMLITDYSAIAVEAALIGLKTIYYLFDYEEYSQQNGLNLDLPAEFPELVAFTQEELEDKLASAYPYEALERYQQKYLFEDPGHSTADLVNILEEKGQLCR